MNTLLRSAPPVLPFPPPSHNSLSATSTGKLRNRPLRILSGTTSERKPKAQTDDYHTTLKALNSKSRFPRKSLGQHYMVNGSVNEDLVAMANVKEGDLVLEIGPGTGSLTNVLIVAGATVLAIEKDPYMAALVRERFAGLECVKVIEEDFTKCHIRSHMSSILSSGLSSSAAKVVANIPFNISTDVVKQLLPMGDIFSDVTLLLQDEAALRLVDSSLKSSEYRPINIFVNFFSDPQYKIKVSRTNFFPQPKVDAAIVVFKLKKMADYPRVTSIKSFFSMVCLQQLEENNLSFWMRNIRMNYKITPEIMVNLETRDYNLQFTPQLSPYFYDKIKHQVNCAFNEKRKMLRKSLQHICPSIEIEAALCAINLLPTSRPEELTVDDFVKLHDLIMKTCR